MPTKPRREDRLIEIFLSSYDNKSWADAGLRWMDQEFDSAVEVVATRKLDGSKLAIEHTIIEPFLGDKGDLAQFVKAFQEIVDDTGLQVPDRITRVYVPVGILDQRNLKARQAIVRALHDWLKKNASTLELTMLGFEKKTCPVTLPDKTVLDVELTVQVIPEPGYSSFRLARQQVSVDLDKVVEKALEKKLPKLLRTEADRRILMLERQHMNSTAAQILHEVERLRSGFPHIGQIDEIWFAETMFYERDGAVNFYRYGSGGSTLGEISFWDGRVRIRRDENMPYPITE